MGCGRLESLVSFGGPNIHASYAVGPAHHAEYDPNI